MNKQDHLMYFLGQLKSNIEHLAEEVGTHDSPLFEKLTVLEQFFNASMHDIFFNEFDNDDKLITELRDYTKKHHD